MGLRESGAVWCRVVIRPSYLVPLLTLSFHSHSSPNSSISRSFIHKCPGNSFHQKVRLLQLPFLPLIVPLPSPIPRSPVQSTPPEAKDIKDNAVVSRSVTPIPSRPTTPKPPGTAEQQAHLRSGMLTIRIFSGGSPAQQLRVC